MSKEKSKIEPTIKPAVVETKTDKLVEVKILRGLIYKYNQPGAVGSVKAFPTALAEQMIANGDAILP